MKLRMLAAPAALALSATLFAGCTSTPPTPADPKQAVAQFLTETGKGKDMTTTLTLDTTPEDLQKIVAAASTGEMKASDKQNLDIALRIVPKLAVKTVLHSNGAELNVEKDPAKIDGQFTISVDGKPLEAAWIASQAYLHADVEGIGQATGLFTATQVKMMANSYAAQMPWINDIVDGKWVALDKQTILTFIDKTKMATASPSAASSLDAARVQAAFLDASQVTKVDDKTYKISTDAKKLIKASAAASPNDEFDDAKADEMNAKINDGATLDSTVTVVDGKASKVVIDIADILRTWPKADPDEPQLAKIAATEFKLNGVMEMSTADPKLVAPSAASTVPAKDLEAIMPKS